MPSPLTSLVDHRVRLAARPVGQTVGQLARICDCRVAGIAGAAAQCDGVIRALGFDACVDHKAAAPGVESPTRARRDAVREGLKQHCPQGVDSYFDNVGGELT